MKWTHKNIDITINPSNGKFGYTIVEYQECDSLAMAKSLIDIELKEYYKFTSNDKKAMFKKLNKREKHFVETLMKEFKNHNENAYCQIGWMGFDWEYE